MLIVLAHGWIWVAGVPVVRADTTPQVLPFTQSWTVPSLITADDSWSGVPGIVGIRGDNLTASTGTDPQTIVSEEFTIDVIANQSNPNSLANGGVAEFDGLANPCVALQASGTADAPHLLLTVTTAGTEFVRVTYTLRDVDGTTDNAVQPVALQYRLGTSGNFTNVPVAFVADASAGPSIANYETPVSVVLPSEAGDQPVVQIRFITANAVGNDEWVAVDDILVESAATSPTGSGIANPASVQAGATSLLSVFVTPGSYPSSTGLAVNCDLSSVGGSATQPLYDDGTHGDVTPADNVFTYDASIPVETSSGQKSLPVTILDAEERSGITQIALEVVAPVSVADAPLAFAARSFPNPFRSSASIEFALPSAMRVRISIFDVNGRLITTLMDDVLLSAGRHQATWAGHDASGVRMPPGSYFCRITADHDHAVRRLILHD